MSCFLCILLNEILASVSRAYQELICASNPILDEPEYKALEDMVQGRIHLILICCDIVHI